MTDTSWYPENYYSDPLPHYKTMPEYLRVEDLYARQLNGERQKLWRAWRDRAFLQWYPVGFDIRIRERDADFGFRSHRVTLVVVNNQYNHEGFGCFGCTPPGSGDKDDVCPPCAVKGKGWISIDDDVTEQAFLGRNGEFLRYLFAHEFGHCLGFTHGGTGVMDATPYHPMVNDEEIAAAREYWL